MTGSGRPSTKSNYLKFPGQPLISWIEYRITIVLLKTFTTGLSHSFENLRRLGIRQAPRFWVYVMSPDVCLSVMSVCHRCHRMSPRARLQHRHTGADHRCRITRCDVRCGSVHISVTFTAASPAAFGPAVVRFAFGPAVVRSFGVAMARQSGPFCCDVRFGVLGTFYCKSEAPEASNWGSQAEIVYRDGLLETSKGRCWYVFATEVVDLFPADSTGLVNKATIGRRRRCRTRWDILSRWDSAQCGLEAKRDKSKQQSSCSLFYF